MPARQRNLAVFTKDKLAIMKSAFAFWNTCLLLRFSTVALLLAVHPCHAESTVFEISKSLQAAITKSLPGFEAHIGHESGGYAAVIVKKPIPNDVEHEIKVSVFQRAAAGDTYQLVTASKSWNEYLLNRVGWSIRIKNQSIFLTLGGSTSCCSGFDTELRFKKMGESFRLIGEETWSHGTENSGLDNEKYFESRTSINYLSRKVIHSKLSGARRDCRDNESALWGRVTRFCFGQTPKRKEFSFSFSDPSIIELLEFQPDNYWAYQKKSPGLCGYINEKMKYQPCKQEKQVD